MSARGPGPAQARGSRLLARRWISPQTFEIVLTRPAGLSFQAGQHLRLRIGPDERDYSMVSAPGDPELVLCIRRVAGPGLSDQLARCPIGTHLTFTGPHGHFTYRRSDRKAVFVATGTGIAPFVAMARAGARAFTLLHGVRRSDELLYAGELAASAGRYVGCLTEPGNPGGSPDGGIFRGRVTAFLEGVLEPDLYDFYLCGGTEMIRDATWIADRRFPRSRVYYESFF